MAYMILMVAALIADQLTKYLVRSNMAVGESISVIGDFFRLTHYENDGAAFSSLSGQRAILIIIPVIAIIAGLVYMFTHRRAQDMFDFSIFPPIFNVADICVVVGCGLLIVYIFLYDRLEKKDERD